MIQYHDKSVRTPLIRYPTVFLTYVVYSENKLYAETGNYPFPPAESLAV